MYVVQVVAYIQIIPILMEHIITKTEEKVFRVYLESFLEAQAS